MEDIMMNKLTRIQWFMDKMDMVFSDDKDDISGLMKRLDQVEREIYKE